MDLIPAALAYLARYAASTAHLRRVLQRKVQRRALRSENPMPPATEIAAAIDAAVERMTGLGLLNETEYATNLAIQYRERGESLSKVRLRLLAKGLEADDIVAAIEPLDDDELVAAKRYAQRKRLGPYRLHPGKPDQPKRDIASLCRAGFSISISRKIVES